MSSVSRARVALLFAAAVVVIGLFAGPASAHAAYKDSDPPDESSVSSPPSSVWAEFTEPVTMDSYLSISDPCGARVDNGDSQVTGARITVSMNGTAAGTYTVSFSVISAVDGHPTTGSFTFTSTGGESCAGEEPPSEEAEPAPRQDEPAGRPKTGDGAAPGGQDASGNDAGDGEQAAAPTGRSGRGDRDRSATRGDGRARIDLGAPTGMPGEQPVAPPVEEPGVWDLPMDGFAAALMIAAAIGAVGGRIYAGIVSPDA